MFCVDGLHQLFMGLNMALTIVDRVMLSDELCDEDDDNVYLGKFQCEVG